jgi:hypothetical protein
MSITNVASSFTYLAPVMAVAQTAPTARVVESAAASATGDQDERMNDQNRAYAAQSAVSQLTEGGGRPAPATLVRIQAETPATPQSASQASRAYSGG